MDDLVKEFIDETKESLGEMDMDLVNLEKEPNNQELLGKIFRLMHTIKGTCGFIGLSRLEKTAHAAENLLDNFRSGAMEVSETSMTLLFMAIDRVRYLTDEVNKTGAEPAGEDSDIIEAIEENIKAELGGGKSKAKAKPEEKAKAKKEKKPAAKKQKPAENTVTEPKEPESRTEEKAALKPAEETAPQAEKTPEYLRVQMNVLEDLINMVSELVLTRNQLLQLVRAEESSPMKTPLQRLNRIVSDLQDSVMKTRMQPIGNAWAKLPRIVRDLSTDMKKKITLEMEGEDTELDRQVLELIKDPLTHMVRNSCDHGIENPDERLAAGKKEEGVIHLRAYHEGGFIIIRIQDDGKGLDPQKIAAKAVENGLVEADKIDKLNEKQILEFIMRPGFSTAEAVTSVSGRGVGMDVVRANIEKIGGSIDMDSQLGKGTSFTVRIPLTLAIISALIVEVDKYRYAIPQMNIQELVSLTDSQEEMIEYINDKPVLRLRDRIIPLLDSSALFRRQPQQGSAFKPESIKGDSEKLVAVMSTGSSYYGIIVDKIFDTEEVVIKSVSSVLKEANIFAGNTILGDGQVIMILDPAAIARKFNVEKEVSQMEAGHARTQDLQRLGQEKAFMLVFRAGQGALKAVPLAMVSRLHVFQAGDVSVSADKMVVQYNGNLMQLCFIDPDSQKLGETEITTLVLSDDRSDSTLALVIDEVDDIVEGALDLNISTKRPGILGCMILDDETVDVIEITHFLSHSRVDWFSSLTHAQNPYVEAHQDRPANDKETGEAAPSSGKRTAVPQSGKKPRVLVVDDSTFFRNMLHPILSAEGYDVILSEDALNAIRLHDEGEMFDIVLSDIEMPGMDGYEFVEKMRADSAWKDTPFIAITSHNTTADAEYGYKKGFDQYIGKLDKDELIRSINQVRMAA